MKPAGNTFVISGGCSGLGLATALALHRAGAYISLLDLNAENGEQVLKQLNNERVVFFETDVSDTKSVQAAVDGTVKWIEKTGKPMAGVVPAAGVGSAAKVCSLLHLIRHRELALTQCPRYTMHDQNRRYPSKPLTSS